ncbi:MAG: rod shape-determining protein [Firmicutes bacterium]|nr:rod shape-determining protein [Bacillota bacterium]
MTDKKIKSLDFRFWQRDLAIDLGTTNTLIYMPRKGIVLEEPSVIALRNGTVAAAGKKAFRMLGRTPPGITAVKPLQGGVIADFEMTRKMLDYFISRVLRRFPFLRLRMMVTVPFGTTQVERRAVLAAGKRAGVKETYLIEEPVAAAIGGGLPVAEPRGSFIVNSGGGVTEIAVISLGGIVLGSSLPQGGETIDEAIQRHIYRKYRMEIGLSTAEEAKKKAVYALDPPEDLVYSFHGINLYRRIPDILEVKAVELHEVIAPQLAALTGAVRTIFEGIPAQLATDVMQDGIVLVGGGSLLQNLDAYLSREMNLPVRRVKDPFTCVVRGASESLGFLKNLALPEKQPPEPLFR